MTSRVYVKRERGFALPVEETTLLSRSTGSDADADAGERRRRRRAGENFSPSRVTAHPASGKFQLRTAFGAMKDGLKVRKGKTLAKLARLWVKRKGGLVVVV